MMHLKITDEIRGRCLREAAHDAHINDRIVTSTPQTLAERGMTMLGSTRATPRIRSYIYCDAVNDNTEELKRAYGTNPRKIGADYYIDDKAMLPDLFVP